MQIRRDEAIPVLDLVTDRKVCRFSGLYQQQKTDREKYGCFAELAWDPVPKEVEDNDVLKACFASVLLTNTLRDPRSLKSVYSSHASVMYH